MKHSEAKAYFNEIVQKAENLFNKDFNDINLQIDPKPKGRNTLAYYMPRTKTVHLNDVLLETLSEVDIKTTIIHEIAHHITPILYPHHKQNHGPEFKRIDEALGGEGTTKAKVDNIAAFQARSSIRKVQTFEATCDCKTFSITTNRRTRMLNGAKYYCGDCKGYLELVK